MDRPSSPQLDSIIRAASNIREIEARLIEAKQKLVTEVEALETITDKADRLKVAIYAYWHVPEANANQLAKLAVGKESSAIMLKRADAVSIGVPCDRCETDLAITSRAMMQKVQAAVGGSTYRWQEGWRIICDDCRAEVIDARHEKWQQHDAARANRCRVLAGLSYPDYLQTPDWQERRASAFQSILNVRGELSCEVCPEREGLSLVHLQLDLDGGREEVSLLCATCSGALASVGKLARSPLPANRASRIDLDPLEQSYRAERGWEPI